MSISARVLVKYSFLLVTTVFLLWIVSITRWLRPYQSKSYELCVAESYDQSLSGHFIAEKQMDRSSRIAQLQGLDELAVEVQDLYIHRLNMGLTGGSSSSKSCLPIPLIYECSRECGGLGDRLKGLASTFYLALLTNSRFYYSWTLPTDINNYFTASNSSLSSPAGTAGSLFGIKYLNMYEWWCMNWHCMVRDLKRTTEGNLNDLWNGYDSVISHTNMAYWDLLVVNPHLATTAKHYNLRVLRQDEMFYIFVKLYFTKVTRFMQLALLPYKEITDRNDIFKIGVQIRIGNDTPAWEESVRHSMESVSCFVNKAVGKCAEQARNGRTTKCLLFVSSDSQNAINAFKEILKAGGQEIDVYQATGTISHIDKPDYAYNKDVVVEHARAFVDWYILSKMDYLYISRSGFGETAAFAGLVPAERMLVGEERTCTFRAWSGAAASKLW